MIAQVTTPEYESWYRNACRNKLYFGCLLPVQLELFGKSSGCFFAGEEAAVDANGRNVIACGSYDPEEMAGFLAFLDKHSLITDGPCPAGWRLDHYLHLYTIEPGQRLQLGPKPEGLTLNETPSPYGVAGVLFGDRPDRRDDFYAELCTKRNHGRALVWTLEQEGKILSTVGAYALWAGQAYLACGQTDPALRGRGIGGWLIPHMANTLAAQGWQPLLLAKPERVHFYDRLGFTLQAKIPVYRDSIV